MQYDNRRDYEADVALARCGFEHWDAHDYSEYEPDEDGEEPDSDWYAEEGEAAYRLANGR